jgi:hypothetical protein
MDINRGAQQKLRYPVARFNEKGCLQVWGGDAFMLYFCLFWNSLRLVLMSSSAKHI